MFCIFSKGFEKYGLQYIFRIILVNEESLYVILRKISRFLILLDELQILKCT